MNTLYVNGGSSESNGGNFKKTNFILKENAAKLWSTYPVSGVTEFKPYPVFDEAGNPCPPRMPSQYEKDGKVPEAESLTQEEIRDYEGEVIPPAFTCVPTVSWVGKEGVHFVDFCSDLADYANADEQEAGVLPMTPYNTMVRTLNKLIPSDRNPQGDGMPCPPTLAKSRTGAKGTIGLKFASQTIMVRGALKRFRGKPMETKASTNGVLWRACLLISQTSARLALRNEFSKKTQPQAPIGPDNFALSGMFDPMGTFLRFTKLNPNDKTSDITVAAEYDQEFNKALVGFFAVEDEGQYYAKIREELGAFPDIESMLNIMTVQQQLELIIAQFPPAWVWFGLRDSRYASMIPETVKTAALQDPEWSQRFGITNVTTAPVQDAIPMGSAPSTPKPGFVKASGSFTPKSVGEYVPPVQPRVQEVMKESSVEYTPKSTVVPDEAAQKLMNKWGIK